MSGVALFSSPSLSLSLSPSRDAQQREREREREGFAPIDGYKDVLFIRTPRRKERGEKRSLSLYTHLSAHTRGQQWSSVFLACSDVTRDSFDRSIRSVS